MTTMVIRTATTVLVLATLMLASVSPARARHRHARAMFMTAGEAPHAGDAGAPGAGFGGGVQGPEGCSCHWPDAGDGRAEVRVERRRVTVDRMAEAEMAGMAMAGTAKTITPWEASGMPKSASSAELEGVGINPHVRC